MTKTLKERALHRKNVAIVYNQSERDDQAGVAIPYSKETTDVCTYHKQKGSRFVRNISKGGKAGSKLTKDQLIKAVGNSSPIYNGSLRDEALILLMVSQSIMPYSRVSKFGTNHSTPILLYAGLFNNMPHIPGIKSRHVFLSRIGFDLIDHWADKYKRFTPYYDAFVNKKIRDKANQFGVAHELGIVPVEIKQIVDINTELDKKLLKREKTFNIQKIIQSAKHKVSLFTTGGLSAGQTVPSQTALMQQHQMDMLRAQQNTILIPNPQAAQNAYRPGSAFGYRK